MKGTFKCKTYGRLITDSLFGFSTWSMHVQRHHSATEMGTCTTHNEQFHVSFWKGGIIRSERVVVGTDGLFTCLEVNPVKILRNIGEYIRKICCDTGFNSPGYYPNSIVSPSGWIHVVQTTAYINKTKPRLLCSSL